MTAIKVPTKDGSMDKNGNGTLADSAELCRSLHLMSGEGETFSGHELIQADALDLSTWVASFLGAGGALAGPPASSPGANLLPWSTGGEDRGPGEPGRAREQEAS